jgi:hypothetical protein
LSTKTNFVLPSNADVVDLGKYLDRANRMDTKGAVRLRAYGDVLTVYVAPIFSGDYEEDAPIVLGLRTLQLAEATEFDLTVLISELLSKVNSVAAGEAQDEHLSLSDRLLNLTGKGPSKENQIDLDFETVNVSWSTETPTRTGWEFGGEIPESELTEIARKGIAEVSETLPSSVGGPIAARVRSEIWGRAFDYKFPLPMGSAFVAAGLGFLTEGEIVPWYVSGDWVRLSSEHGHVLARFAKDYVPLKA